MFMKMKNKYESPVIQWRDIFLESGFCIGSACVKPQTKNDVIQEWETQADDSRTFEWDWN